MKNSSNCSKQSNRLHTISQILTIANPLFGLPTIQPIFSKGYWITAKRPDHRSGIKQGNAFSKWLREKYRVIFLTASPLLITKRLTSQPEALSDEGFHPWSDGNTITRGTMFKLNSIALISLSLIRLEAPYLLLSKLLSRWVRVIFFEGIRTDGLGVKQSKSKVVLWR